MRQSKFSGIKSLKLKQKGKYFVNVANENNDEDGRSTGNSQVVTRSNNTGERFVEDVPVGAFAVPDSANDLEERSLPDGSP